MEYFKKPPKNGSLWRDDSDWDVDESPISRRPEDCSIELIPPEQRAPVHYGSELDYSEESLALLRRGVDEWNLSRRGREITNRPHFNASVELFMNLNHVNLAQVSLPGIDFSRMTIQCADLSCAELSYASFCDTHLEGTDFSGSDLTKTDFLISYLNNTNFKYANLQHSTIGGDLNGSCFTGANLSHAVFRDVRLNASVLDAEVSRATIDWRTIAKSLHLDGFRTVSESHWNAGCRSNIHDRFAPRSRRS